MHSSFSALGARRSVRSALWRVSAACVVAACSTSEILDVEDPDVVRPDAVQGAASLPVLLAGAQTDFQVAYNGGNGTTEGQANFVGLFTDEFIQTESFPTRQEVEIREITRENTTMSPLFTDLARARASSERAARKYVEFEQANAAGRAQVLNLAGYSYILFGENYCSGVPFSTLLDDQSIEYGMPLTTVQMFQIAIAKFDTALTIASGIGASANAQANLARVGRGRALLNLARFADAAAAVAAVPTGFEFGVQHSENSPRQNNGIWNLSTSQGRWGVSEAEGGNGLPFRTAADVRVPNRPRAAGGGNGFDGAPMQEQLKYSERNTKIVLADGVEARLIEAEAALQAGNAATMITKLNEVRASAQIRLIRDLQRNAPPGQTLDQLLAPLTNPATQAAQQNLLFRERGFWFYATSHRLGDLRRLVRQYGRAANTVFPTGNYVSPGARRTGTYGSDLSFPIPIEEGNNPNLPTGGPAALKGCIDRNA